MTTPVRALLPALALALAGCMSFHTGAMPGEPKAAVFANVEGARVRYVDVGEGPPVVLVHGFASSLETWDAVLPTLRKHHRVIALDLKGFGWTDRPEGDYSPKAQARLILSLLDQRGVKSAAFVGHSWGTSIVLAAALEAPSRVERIALYDAFVYEEQLPTFFTMARTPGVGEVLFGLWYKERPDERMALTFYDKSLLSEELAEAVEKSLERPGTVAAALEAVRGQRYAEVEDRYRTIKQPTLLLWGREDVVTPLHIGERLARDLPGARLVVYPKCGHFPMLEVAGPSTAELDAFLDAPLAPAGAPRPAYAPVPAPIKVDAAKPDATKPDATKGDAAPAKETP